MREHKNHPVIFSGLRCSIPLPKLNHFLIKILKSNGFLIKKTKICFEFWRRRRQPKILIYIFLPDLATYYWNTERFFNKIIMKTTFSWSKHEDSSKKFLPSLLKFAKIFMIFNFFNKISQNPKKKTRAFLQNIHELNKKTLEALFKTTTIFADVIRRKTQSVHGVLFMLSHTAARPAHIIF